MMLLQLSKYNIRMKCIGADCVQLHHLSHLINTDGAKPVTGLDVTIAQVVKIKGENS